MSFILHPDQSVQIEDQDQIMNPCMHSCRGSVYFCLVYSTSKDSLM